MLAMAMLLTPSTGREPVVLDRLEGEWRLAGWVYGGVDRMQNVPAGTFPNRWVIRRSIMTIFHDDKLLVGDLKVVIDEKANPKTFTVTYVGNDENLKLRYKDGVRGICKFERDTWTRCMHADGKQLPEKFESPVGQAINLQTLKRVPPK
jgi:uncharacterized protein (TIGR03067 family)